MEFSYGTGEYVEGEKRHKGTIILGEHKLYLKEDNQDIAQTYIPLEKIERIRKKGKGVEILTRPSIYFRYTALITGEPQYIAELIKDLVRRRGLKKGFLKKEWVDRGN